jgi:Calcineurin-like phosphoesterase
MRILAISDLHTDFRANWELLNQLPASACKNNALLVAGDIADRLETISETLSLLRQKFSHLFYVPGNHELWVRQEACHSVDKLHKVIELCDRLGVQTRPGRVKDLWVVPLFSWYDPDFDSEGDAETSELEGWADYHFCQWPEGIGSISEFLLRMNEPHLKIYDSTVISLSHFLPRRDLLAAAADLRFKGLPKVAGCAALDKQIRRLGSVLHVFGHSHINCDRVIDGVRYVQNALRYPRERASAAVFPVKVIWDFNERAQEEDPAAAL